MSNLIKKTGEDLLDSSLDFFEQVPAILSSPELLSDPNAVLIRAGALIASKKISRLFAELRERRQKGRIKATSQNSGKAQQSLVDMIRAINDGIDEDKFQAMKSIFFFAISIDTNLKEENEAYTIMNVCKKLSGPQILILSKFYEYGLNTNEPLFNSSHSADEWFKIVSDDLGMVDPSIVKDHVIGLNEQHLLSPYLGTSAGPKILSTQLLSSLGIRLCVFLSKNDPDEIVNG